MGTHSSVTGGRSTVVRALHDLGLAAWFGGTLMGAVGLNGGAAAARDGSERLRISSAGWARWAPVQLAAMIVHGVGGVGLILANRARLAGQPEARTNTVIKAVVTAAAIVATVYTGMLGAYIARHADEGGEGVTEPGPEASDTLASAQRQQRIAQWTLPALTAVLIVLSAQQGEQQRPVVGILQRIANR
ncbi:hypothetical protein [Microbacterium invictum]|uniref:Integral membrane protein n=1 Tax=Microbacterium invictum TaxID=515415 RepID=A0ABZ0VEV8_9MICO|nr:hypothetical protein [Microbacterium invictum]WQB71206.1 hypothetical protein T9R20_04355 [Microbacterium invictum]